MTEERRRLIKKVLVLSWGRDDGEEACSVFGATNGDGGGSWTEKGPKRGGVWKESTWENVSMESGEDQEDQEESGYEKDFTAQGSAKDRGVCSFIGVGLPWPLRFLVNGSSERGSSVCSRASSCRGLRKLWRVSRS